MKRPLNKKQTLAHLALGICGALALFIFINFLFPISAFATINKQINYQGKLTTPAGVGVADGSYNMRFKLYTVSSGGSPLWTETWCKGSTCNGTGSDNRVSVVGGLFSIMLGSQTSLVGVDFNQALYLGVEIGSSTASSTWDGEMTPRKVIGAVPAAFVADTLQDILPSSFFRNDVANSTSSASTYLSVTQTGGGKIAELFGTGSASVFSALSSGFVGIGTTTPYSTLSIEGSTSSPTTNLFTIASSTGANLFTINSAGAALFNNAAGSAGQILQSIGSTGSPTWIATSSLGITSSQWTTTGSDIYYATGKVGVGTSSPIATFNVKGAGGVNPFVVASSTGTALLTLLQNGNFGIGSSTPSSLLTVNGTAYLGTTTLSNVSGSTQCLQADTNGVVTGSGSACGGGGSGNSAFTIGSGFIYNATSTDLVGIGSTSPIATLSVKGKAGTNPFLISSSTNASLFSVLSNGNVGIGTASPASALDVYGGVALGQTNQFKVSSTGNVTGSGTLSLNGAYVNSAGDLGVARSSTSGYIYFGNAPTNYIGFSSGQFTMAGSNGATIGNGRTYLVGNTEVYTLGLQRSDYGTNYYLGVSASTTPALIFSNNLGTETMRLNYSGGLSVGNNTWNGTNPGAGNVAIQGNVGIGTPTPVANLEVNTPVAGSGCPGSCVSSVYPSGNWAGIIDQSTNSSGYNGLLVTNRWLSSASTILDVGQTVASTGAYTSSFKVTGDGVTTFGQGFNTQGINVRGAFPTTFSLVSNGNNNSSNYQGAFIGNNLQSTNNQGVTIGNFYNDTTPVLTVSGGNTFSGSSDPTSAGTVLLRVLGNGKVGIGSTTPISTLAVKGTGGTNPFVISSSTDTQLLTLLQNGNFGVGSSTPSNLLTVTGTAYLGTTTLANVRGSTQCLQADANGVVTGSGSACGSGGGGGGNSAFTIGSGVIYNATSTDLVGIGSTSPIATLSVKGKGGTNPFIVASSTNTQMLTLLQNGNFGIGSSTPIASLAINGLATTNPFLIASSSTQLFLVSTAGNVTAAGSVTATNFVGTGSTASTFAGPITDTYCVTGDTKIRRRKRRKDGTTADDEFEDVPIKDIEEGDMIESYDEATNTLVFMPVKALYDTGTKEIWKITTATGLTIRTTSEHPYYAKNSSGDKGTWVKVKKLTVGTSILVVIDSARKMGWDTITSIEVLPAEQVFDIEITDTHNFIANCILAHNTAMSWDGTTLNVCGNIFAYSPSNGASNVGCGNSMGGGGNENAFGQSNSLNGGRANAFGYANTAGNSSGYDSAFGNCNTACGGCSSAFGYNNSAGYISDSAFGYQNQAIGGFSSSFGWGNCASNYYDVAVGTCNYAAGGSSSAIGGYNNAPGSESSAVGYNNCAGYTSDSAFGYSNCALGGYSSSFGWGNQTCDSASSAFGFQNSTDSNSQFSNAVGNNNSVIGGYCSNAFGSGNTASGFAVSAYGYNNAVCSNEASGAFGYQNSISDGMGGVVSLSYAIGGYNTVNGNGASAYGVQNSVCSGSDCASAFGQGNSVAGAFSNAFGQGNSVSGTCSSAFGYQNQAEADCVSLFGTNLYSADAGTTMLGQNTITALSIAGYGTGCFTAINGATPTGDHLVDSSGACLTSSGIWLSVSDRNKKENFTPLDPQVILSKINQLPITEWNYKTDPTTLRHIGPVAQDFYSIFDIGNSSTTISSIDPAGVAFLGIQALTDNLASTTASTSNAIAALNIKLDELLASTSASSTSMAGAGAANATFSSMIQSAIASVTDWIGNTVTAATGYFGSITVDNLHVNKGIEMVDQDTGETYCIVLKSGDFAKTKGPCVTTTTSTTSDVSGLGVVTTSSGTTTSSSTDSVTIDLSSNSTATTTPTTATSTITASSTSATDTATVTATSTSDTMTASSTSTVSSGTSVTPDATSSVSVAPAPSTPDISTPAPTTDTSSASTTGA